MTIMCFCFCLFFHHSTDAKFINVYSGTESFAAASHTEIQMGYFMRNKTIRSLNLGEYFPKIYSRKQNLQTSFLDFQQRSNSLLSVQLVNDTPFQVMTIYVLFFTPNCIKKSRSGAGVEC